MCAQRNNESAPTPQIKTHYNDATRSAMKDEIAAAATRAAPPVVVTGTSALLDLTINQWVGIATLLYLALQAVVLVRNEFIRKRGE